MLQQKFPSNTGILRWSGAHELATKKEDVVVVKKEVHDKAFPAGLFYYFKRGEARWLELVMICSRNIFEEVVN